MAYKTPKKDPWQQALDALSRRSLTTAEVRDKLRRSGHAREAVDEVVAKLVRLSLVDDQSVAYNHARHRAQEAKRGPRRVRAELLRRGIPAELAEQALEEAFPPQQEEEAFERAVARLAGRAGVPRDRPGRLRLARRLLRAGFDSGKVASWMGASDDGWADEATEDE